MLHSLLLSVLLFVVPASVLTIGITVDTVEDFQWEVLSSYNHFTKRLSAGIYIGGRPTSRDLEYLSKAGFRSVASIVDFNQTDTVYNGVNGNFPSTAEEKDIVNSYNMQYKYFENITFNKESVQRITEGLISIPKPVFLHCHVGYSASYFAELFTYKTGSLIDAQGIYDSGLSLGYDWQSNADMVSLVNTLTGADTMVVEPTLEKKLANGEDSYRYYYWSHRVGNDTFYNAGQILETQVASIATAGYTVVISFRADGESAAELEFSSLNNGVLVYNGTKEAEAFASYNITFYQLPVTGDDAWSSSTLEKYTPLLIQAAGAGSVLAHCGTGYRSSAYMTAFLAQQEGKCTNWAVQQAKKIGYSFDIREQDEKVMNFYKESLNC